MYIAAIYGLKEDRQEAAQRLAAALGVAGYDAVARLHAPGDILALGAFADKGPAISLLERLRAGGFNGTLLGPEEIAAETSLQPVRRFELREAGICVHTAKETMDIPYPGIRLILRGNRFESTTTTETIKTRSLSLERAILSSGLMLTKTTKETVRKTTEERTGFVNLYSEGGLAVQLREDALSFDCLGPLRKLSRSASFATLVDELRRRAPKALFDDRLLSRAGQKALLGPALNPERQAGAAIALVAKVLLSRA